MNEKKSLHPLLEQTMRIKEGQRAALVREFRTSEGEKAPTGIGYLTLIATDARTGEIKQIERGENMVVKLGRSALAHLLAGDNVDVHKVTAMMFGDSAQAPVVGDTGIIGAVISVAGSNLVPVTVDFPDSAGDDMKVSFTAVINAADGNGSGTQVYREACMVQNGGSIFSRKVTGAITKDNTVVLTATWTYIF